MKVQKVLIKRAKKDPMKLQKREKPIREPYIDLSPKFVRRNQFVMSHREI